MENDMIVVKYGSNCLTDTQGIMWGNLGFFASQLAVESQSHGLVVVTSGAVALGRSIFDKKRPHEIATDRVYAQIGAHGIFSAWSKAFDEFDMLAASLPVTHHELDDIEEGSQFLDAIEDNARHGVVTLVNENDALSNFELSRLSDEADNDEIASHIAVNIGAKELFLMTDKRGIRRRDRNKSGIRNVPANDKAQQAIFKHIDDGKSTGRGGMASKGRAAINAANAGITAYIADAKSSFRAIRSTGKTQSSTKFEAKKH